MSTLSDFVTVNITTLSQTPTRVGFGTPMVFGYHTANADLIRSYPNLAALVADGITATGVGAGTYAAVSKAFSQSPRPAVVKVGRRSTAFTQVVRLDPLTAVAGATYSIGVGMLGGAMTTLTRTVPGSSTISAECTALKALIDGLGLAITVAIVSSTYLTLTANVAGTMFDLSAPSSTFKITTTTTLPANMVTDLTAIQAVDNDWYGITLDSNSSLEVQAIAAWIETQLKVFAYDTADTDCGNAGSTTDVMYILKAANYFRTLGIFDSQRLVSGAGIAALAENFPFAPGSGTYANKTLKGVVTDVLSSTVDSAVVAKNGTTYTSVAGLSITKPGKSAAGEFFDIAVGRDWLQARMKERIFGRITAGRKLPFTDSGIQAIVAEVMAQLQDGIDSGFLAASPAPVVLAPKASAVSTTDKANRTLNNVTFSATLAGAIHSATISGTISV